EEWNKVVDVDLKGVFLAARAAARQMIDQGEGGRIIAVSSIVGLKAAASVSAYAAAKGGVVNLVRSLALEWARNGITVNAICPGYVLTDMNTEALANQKVYDKIVGDTMLRRLGKPEEMGAAVLYLASEFASFTTGTYIAVDGGGSAL
ncbi:MAG: SDR family NAD(P)-dependent oxidoreductase, partial [Oscillospiraceae bacterium]